MLFQKYPYLTNKDFLLEIDESLVLSQYVKIILLNWDEQPIQEIQGRITGGNISINGDSSIRRTCNLSAFFMDDELEKKIMLYIPVLKKIDFIQEKYRKIARNIIKFLLPSNRKQINIIEIK